MKHYQPDQSSLVEEIVAHLLEKFERLPTENKSLIALATIEATAWIIAMEVVTHAKTHDCKPEDLEDRTDKYAGLFASMIKMEVAKFSNT